ncbi:MAG: HipA domain-containing protein [Bacillota bacterium]|nr:HipA domain-containing protein [Bacillota bacterium]
MERLFARCENGWRQSDECRFRQPVKGIEVSVKEEEKRWRLAPAYDLTYSHSIGGEHATAVNGNGKNPSLADIREVAKKAKIDLAKAERIANEIYEAVKTELKEYLL